MLGGNIIKYKLAKIQHDSKGVPIITITTHPRNFSIYPVLSEVFPVLGHYQQAKTYSNQAVPSKVS
jgi:hypothetical protein